MILKELMREYCDVFKLTENARISNAAEMMYEKKIGAIVIVDEVDFVKGIITDRDIALSLALGAATPESFVSEVMTKDVETINESMNLFDVTRHIKSVNVKRLPVLDAFGKLRGIISVDDIMAILSREMFDTCSSLESKLGHLV